MEFCVQCESLLRKQETSDGKIIFICRCGMRYEGTPVDTLIYKKQMNTKGSQHVTMIENSPYDDAGNKVFKQCKKCTLPFTTKVILVDVGQTYYTCDCGFVMSHQEYNS